MNIWSGAFAPRFWKHRDFCGDINNHIDYDAADMEMIDYDEETGVGTFLVKVYFVGGDEVAYEYEIEMEVEQEHDKEAVKAAIVRQIKHK